MGKKIISVLGIIAFLLGGCQIADTQKTIIVSPEVTASPKLSMDKNPPRIQSETPPIIKVIPTPTLNFEEEITLRPFYKQFSTMDKQDLEVYRIKKTAIFQFSGKCREDHIIIGISPDTKWLVCENPDVAPHELYFVNESNEEIRFQIPGGNHGGEWNYAWPVHWSSDGKYVWIQLVLEVGELVPCFLTIPSQGLYRVEFPSGYISETLPLHENGYFLQFSPSGRYLAFVSGDHDLTLLDLSTGASSEFFDSQSLTGSMVFSPDEQSLAFSAQDQKSNHVDCDNSTLKIYSLDSGKTETFFTDPQSAPIGLLFWDNSDTIGIRYSRDKFASINVLNRKVTILNR